MHSTKKMSLMCLATVTTGLLFVAPARATDAEIALLTKQLQEAKVQLSTVVAEIEKTKIEIDLVSARILELEELFARTPKPKIKRALDEAYFELSRLKGRLDKLIATQIELSDLITTLEIKLLELQQEKQ